MDRCRETEAIVDKALAGVDLTRAQLAHAAACADCARALLHCRRFEAELARVGLDLAPEPMPSAADAGAIYAHGRTGGQLVTWRRGLVGGAAATLVLAASVFGGGLGLGALFSGGDAPGRIGAAELQAWTDQALSSVLGQVDPFEEASEWEAIRLETCGGTAIAFYRDRGRGPDVADHYVWAVGQPGPVFTPPAGGRAGSVDDEDVARIRTTVPPCQLEIDAATEDVIAQVGADGRDLWSSVDGGGQVDRGAGRVVGVTTMPVAPREDPLDESNSRSYYVLLDRRLAQVVNVERVTMSISDDGFMGVGSDLEGAIDRPAAPPVNQIYADLSSPSEMLFAWIDSPAVRAVDILVGGERLRYTVREPGFVVEFNMNVAVAGEMEFRLLDAHGIVLADGTIRDWEEQDAAHTIRCSDWQELDADAQLAATEPLVERMLDDVRMIQHLPDGASSEEVVAAARSTIDKGCQGSAADRPLSEVVRLYYER